MSISLPVPSQCIAFSEMLSQNITEILKAVHGGDELVEEMSSGLLSPKTRKRVVNTLVSCLIEKHGKQ